MSCRSESRVRDPEASAESAAFAVGYVLLMSILGTPLMGASDRIERLVGVSGTTSSG